MKKKIRVGFDFDGVIAYNPFRLVRAPLTYVKKNLLGVKKLNFWYPQQPWQKLFWIICHESSIFPAKGISLFREMVEKEVIEAHLITARYSFLGDHLYRWLEKHKLNRFFKTVNLNKKDEQPHLFKEKMLKEYDLHYFIEDNLDIVSYLHGRHTTKIYWIYNLIDRKHPHPYKSPHLEHALKEIAKKTK
ncbi:hypothetical protein MUP32_07000 [Candidatus Microgenomates bacterium]|nr:hypothetical protein [Candidatus Microgenomates bacterium]